jgi:hypothetical protein
VPEEDPTFSLPLDVRFGGILYEENSKKISPQHTVREIDAHQKINMSAI